MIDLFDPLKGVLAESGLYSVSYSTHSTGFDQHTAAQRCQLGQLLRIRSAAAAGALDRLRLL